MSVSGGGRPRRRGVRPLAPGSRGLRHQTISRLPYREDVPRPCRIVLQLSPELEEASRISGAGALTTLALITVPLMRQALIYAWILVFILALPELSASIVLKGIHTQTLSTVLLDVWNGNGGLAMACALGMSMFVAVGALLLVAIAVAKRARGVAPVSLVAA